MQILVQETFTTDMADGTDDTSLRETLPTNQTCNFC